MMMMIIIIIIIIFNGCLVFGMFFLLYYFYQVGWCLDVFRMFLGVLLAVFWCIAPAP